MDKLLHMEWSLVWSSGRSLGRSGLAARVKLHNHPQMCSFRLLNSREKKSIRLCCRLRPINGRGSGGGGCTTHASIQSTIHQRQATASQRARQKKTLARDDRKDHSPRDICCVVCVCPHLISGPFSRTTTISRCSRHILNCMTVFRNFSIYPKVSKDLLGTDQEQQQQLSFFLIPDRTTTHGPTCIFFFYVSLVMVIRR